MGTSATISMNINGVAKAMYCNFDGYPSHTGITLKQSYTDDESIKELIAGGSCSRLDKDINEIERYNHGNTGLYMSYKSLEEMYKKRPETSYYYHWDGNCWNLVTENGRFTSPL